MKSKKRISNIHIFALASHGKGISGGDRIFIELSRRWSTSIPITIHTWKEGNEMCERQNLRENKNLIIKIYDLGIFTNTTLFLNYIARIVKGIWIGFSFIPNTNYQLQATCIYNASEFWMDSLPCVLIKLRFPKIKWIASWYQTAPNPFKGYASAQRNKTYRLSALLYWLIQLPIKPLVEKYADKIIVNNDDEKKQFARHTKYDRTIVLIGAVDIETIGKWKLKNRNLPKKFDAVFQGRFHPQKGVEELIDIWAMVVNEIPQAKLAMIGDGPLMENVKLQILNAKLESSVELFGYVFDGPKKYKIFSQSKIVVHPAFYDSGGMAAAEAMAFGLPAIGFDLKAYESYYPEGMLLSSDMKSFANNIVNLLKDRNKLQEIGKKAEYLIKKNYSWDIRASEILNKINL
jgi:glycosyltransferase involved in cell wall biosynthesis